MFKKTLSNLSGLFSISDEQAMWRVQMDADPQAFAVLMERWHDRIYGLCARMLNNSHSAEDITQEVFSRIFEKRKDYDSQRKFATWLWRIAVNRCYDELRKYARRHEFSLEPDEDGQAFVPEQLIETAAPDHHAVAQEEADVIRGALAQLPEIYRSVVVLRHYQGLKLREIAEVLNVPEGTVNSRMAEGLSQLSRLLQPQFPNYTPQRNRAEKRTREPLLI
jgi:RNA polymerase sigma-70 factor (ECF subfamily)